MEDVPGETISGASEAKLTKRPSTVIQGKCETNVLPAVDDPAWLLTRLVVPAVMSRLKMSSSPALWSTKLVTSAVDADSNATYRPSSLITGYVLSPGLPADEAPSALTLTRLLVPVRRS